MNHVYKTTIWTSASGQTYCGDTSDLANNSNLWWYPCRILDISPAELALLLYEKFNCRTMTYNKDKNVFCYSWENLEDAKSWSKFINKAAMKVNFIV